MYGAPQGIRWALRVEGLWLARCRSQSTPRSRPQDQAEACIKAARSCGKSGQACCTRWRLTIFGEAPSEEAASRRSRLSRDNGARSTQLSLRSGRRTGSVNAPAIRKVVYATNVIGLLNYSLCKIVKGRGAFPNDEAVHKLLYLIDCAKRRRSGPSRLEGRTQPVRHTLSMGTESPI